MGAHSEHVPGEKANGPAERRRRDEAGPSVEVGAGLAAPTGLAASDILSVQRAAGNVAATGLIQRQPETRRLAYEYMAPEPSNDETALEPLPLSDLIPLFVTTLRTFRVSTTRAVYGQSWLRSDRGTALLLGYIRARLAQNTDPASQEGQFVSIANDAQGHAGRRQRVIAMVHEAFQRAGAGLRGGVALVEESRGAGSAFADRGPGYGDTGIHSALDVTAREGTPVYTPADGEVLNVGRKRGYGNVVVVLHERPPGTSEAGTQRVVTTYCHLSAQLVRPGQRLSANQAVGLVGHSGRGEGGVNPHMADHVHFALLRVPPRMTPESIFGQLSTRFEQRWALNPALWLGQMGTQTSPGTSTRYQGREVQPEATGATAPQRSPVATAAPIGPTHPARSQGVQRQASAPPQPDNDPARLEESTSEELIRLYLMEEEQQTLFRANATYGRDWVRTERASAQIRDAIRQMIASEQEQSAMRDWYIGVVNVLGGPEERRQQLNALIRATFNAGDRLDQAALEGRPRDLTARGYFARLTEPPRRVNQQGRPKFQQNQASLVPMEGALVHPAVVGPLTGLLSGLRAEGARLNDASAMAARINNGYRAPNQQEGTRYLNAIRRTINRAVDVNGNPYHYPPFPAHLENTARSNLGFSGSPAHRAFRAAIAASPGWTAASASMLLRRTGAFKAPRGGSTHHSGVVVDINWPVRVDNATTNHGMNRDRNEAALRTVAGRWLHEHAPSLGFDSYDTAKEIWHMEWQDWQGTEADPDADAPADG